MSDRLQTPTVPEQIEADNQLRASLDALRDVNAQPISSGHYGNPEGDVLVGGKGILLRTDGEQRAYGRSEDLEYRVTQKDLNSYAGATTTGNVEVNRSGGVVTELTGDRAKTAVHILKKRAARQLGEYAITTGEAKIQKLRDTMDGKDMAA